MGRNLGSTEEDTEGASFGGVVLALLLEWPFLAVLAVLFKWPFLAVLAVLFKWLNFIFLAGEPFWPSFIKELEFLLRALSSLGVWEVDTPSFIKQSNAFMRRE